MGGHMSHKNVILIALAGLLMLAPLAPGEAEVYEVMVQNFSFEPQDLVITAADSVRWVWVEGTHTTTSGVDCTPDGLWDAPIDSDNQEFVFDFTGMSGTFEYFCIPHCTIDMVGTIQVEPVTPNDETTWGKIKSLYR
ncbi:MAG: hypothetical protein GF355_03960 [Candidatus Eisenbacteria bacterium]|nr:hypothetical protein [Candidatus Eisenbacteria bacterium]